MRPAVWRPPVEPSPAEQTIIGLVRRAKLLVWLRQHRHELFDEAFQAELAELAAAWKQSAKGQPPVAPAPLALATVLQAYTGASDDEVIEATVMDRRWQLVLDCLDAERAPFGKGTLVSFRARLIAHDLDTTWTGGWWDARWRWPRPPEGLVIGRCGRRWTPARCGALGGAGGGHQQLVGSRPACWVTPCARRWASSRGSRGGGCRGTRGSPRSPTRPAWRGLGLQRDGGVGPRRGRG